MSISNNIESNFDQNFDNTLHEELRILKYENSDLKFQLQLAKGDSKVYKYYLQSDRQIRSEELEKELNSHKEKICLLEADLKETRQLLEDAKWVNMMTQNLLKTKELEFHELQNELKQNVNNNNHTSLNRSASEDLVISKRSNSARDKSHQYQSMMTINNQNQYYKKGLAPLPQNYKDFVPSLPPINQSVVINGREKILVN